MILYVVLAIFGLGGVLFFYLLHTAKNDPGP